MSGGTGSVDERSDSLGTRRPRRYARSKFVRATECRRASCSGNPRSALRISSPDGLLPRFELDPLDAVLDIASAETTAKYAGYLRRQESEIERARKDERKRIPANFPSRRVPVCRARLFIGSSRSNPTRWGMRSGSRCDGRSGCGARRVRESSVGRAFVTSLEFRDRLARRTRRAKAPITLSMLEPWKRTSGC